MKSGPTLSRLVVRPMWAFDRNAQRIQLGPQSGTGDAENPGRLGEVPSGVAEGFGEQVPVGQGLVIRVEGSRTGVELVLDEPRQVAKVECYRLGPARGLPVGADTGREELRQH